MRFKMMFCVLLLLALMAYAKEPKPFQTGKLLQMDSVACGVSEKDGKSLAGEMLGTVETPHEDDVYTVQPDDGDFPRLVVLRRSMRPLVDEPLIVVGDP